MKEGVILSIDQGTTGSTVLLFDHAGQIRGRAYSEFTQHYPKPGWVEHDAEEIVLVTMKVIAEALKVGGIAANDIQGIGITNQRETAVLWERASGKPVGRAIVWQDRRTADYCAELKEQGHTEMVQQKTGLVIDPYFSGTKVKWMLDNTPGLRKRAERGEICFGTIDSWLVYNLTGGKRHITDYSNASRTLLYNIRELQWDEELLQLLDIPGEMLPEVRPSSEVYGETDPQMFFGTRGIPIAGIAGDQQAALFGQACYKRGMAKNTYGTGSFVLMNTGTEAVPSNEKLLTTIAWGVGDEPVEYALEGAIFVTGSAVQWLRDGLQMIGHAKETRELARSVPENEDVYFVPALVGLGAPHWDPYARGLLIGITRGTSRGHVARAVLESMAYQTRDVIEAMERDSGIRLKELRCDGGASVNSVLMQFQSDILGVNVVVPSIVETTALGSAYLAGLAVGFWESRDEIAKKWALDVRYRPRIEQAKREKLFKRWHRAVELAKGWAKEDD
ncbi:MULTISPECIES: glycerol kinase GlpK [Thiorhodovibrio]|uniref:glycerol kinase GlpK n=1 Tax=Thiorhodovibrio TaxID=61593 RepID=UPI001914D91C|nr:MULTISPECIES: glycerol kinase GlpK [Thiorhodovibrio]MBK5968376.1 glycerol kinase [Thiorhodovibrio winogradskyi]WPL13172.1 Glycerol kinase [Thiorhodovibrio litoralis]